MTPYEDEDEQKEAILKMLGGEVDDYAGSQLENPDKSQGVTIEISVKPHGEKPKEEEAKEEFAKEESEEEEHDPIAHILGMCGGGCAE